MTGDLFIATSKGVVHSQGRGFDWDIVGTSLDDHVATSITGRGRTIFAGTTSGIYRSGDLGQNWEKASIGISEQHIRWLSLHPDYPDLILAGAEPAAIYVSEDGGDHWTNKPEIEDLRDRFNWFLPYSSGEGCVRGFAFQGNRLYAAVEVGGLLYSDDRGRTWQLVEASDGIPKFGTSKQNAIHPDVHSVASHPSSTDLIFAPTGGGFYVSSDGGSTFEQRHPPCYCRAVWADPTDPDHLILGPATGVDREGRIIETADGGDTWQSIEDGSSAPWDHHMVERFLSLDQHLLAILSNGDLIAAEFGRWKWTQLFVGMDRINAVVAIPSRE
jgi:photosystem II stability/assembly factor-like uncharacterized protein